MAAFKAYAECTNQCAIFSDEEFGDEANSFELCLNDHSQYLTVDELYVQHLPVEFRTPEYIEFIGNAMDRTGRVVTSVTSLNRPDTYPGTGVPYPFSDIRGNNKLRRTGTGFLMHSSDLRPSESPKQCPCWLCQRSGESQACSFYFVVQTATHVIFDEHEAQNTRFELFYDTEDREGVEYLYGVGLGDMDTDRLETDTTVLNCVTHNPQLSEMLKRLIDYQATRYKIEGYQWPRDQTIKTPLPILISHPDGCRKRISFGKIIEKRYFMPQGLVPKDVLRNQREENVPPASDSNYRNEFPSKANAPIEPGCPWYKPTSFKHMRPPDTEIQSPDGIQTTCPTTMEMVDIFGMPVQIYRYLSVTYDMASCPGSSGAPVFCTYDSYNSLGLGHHFGVFGQHKMSGCLLV